MEKLPANADNRPAMGLVLRVSELRGLGAVGDSSTERRRLRGCAADLVCRAVRLETKNFRANFSALLLPQIPPSLSPPISTGIFDSGGAGVSRRRNLRTEQLRRAGLSRA